MGSDFHVPEVLPHLFDKSIEYVTTHSEDAKQGKPFFSLFTAVPAAHTDLSPSLHSVMQVESIRMRIL